MSDDAKPRLATRGLSISQRLTLIVLAVAIPMLLLSTAIVWRLAEAQRATQRDDIMYSARAISSAVDAQLGRYITLADALATSPSLKTNDITAFRAQAELALPRLPGAWVVLADTRGQQLVNTFMSASEPLPVISPSILADEARAFETKQTQFSDLVFGKIVKIPVIAVGVPVFRASDPAYYLIVATDVTVFHDLLNSQNIPKGWIGALLDRRGNMITRSLDHERWVGKPATQDFRTVMSQEGWFESRSLDGDITTLGHVVSPLSGWATGIAARKDVFQAPIQQTILVASLAGLLVTLMSVLLATWAARRIKRPIKALETGAQALRRHEGVSFAATGVPEIDHALRAFGTASKELRAQEERRADAEMALVASEKRLRLFVEQAPASIVMFDRNMRYLAASRRWLTLFSPDDQDVTGRSYYEVLPEIPEHWKERHRRALGGEALRAEDEPLIRADGRTQWVTSEIRPWFAPDGTVGGIAIFADDVTDRMREEEEKRTLQAELLHASRLSEIGRMAAAFAHELNQPLTAVASYIGGCRRILRADGNDEGRKRKLQEVMEQANAQALRAGQIIRQLREFVGTGERERTIESAASLMRDAFTLAVAAARHEGISVRSDIDSPGHILVDKVQFQQVIVNLVRNAIEAMENAPRKELAFGITVRDEWIEFSVGDTGSGICPEMTDRLFKPFSTTKGRGMGIGLSVCREIVEAHEGKIWAKPNPGGGTLFRFTLPLVREDEMIAETKPKPSGAPVHA